ncbi:hypothetical protein KKG08_01735 [Patescibacteria group bacterium]|nr:hypothetical protein [Patescibacteria group bacterium]
MYTQEEKDRIMHLMDKVGEIESAAPDGETENQAKTRCRKEYGYLIETKKLIKDDNDPDTILYRNFVYIAMVEVIEIFADDKTIKEVVKKALSYNPINISALLAMMQLDMRAFGKRLVPQGNWLINMVANSVTDAQFKSLVVNHARKIASALEDASKSSDIFIDWLVMWSEKVISLAEGLWDSGIKVPELCSSFLEIDWNRFTEEELKEFKDTIEDLRITAETLLIT